MRVAKAEGHSEAADALVAAGAANDNQTSSWLEVDFSQVLSVFMALAIAYFTGLCMRTMTAKLMAIQRQNGLKRIPASGRGAKKASLKPAATEQQAKRQASNEREKKATTRAAREQAEVRSRALTSSFEPTSVGYLIQHAPCPRRPLVAGCSEGTRGL